MLWTFSIIQVLMVAVLAILNMKYTDRKFLSKCNHIISFIYVMLVAVSINIIMRIADKAYFMNYLKITAVIAGFCFYATDYIKYVKNKEDALTAGKTAKKALVNHVVFSALLIIIFFGENSSI